MSVAMFVHEVTGMDDQSFSWLLILLINACGTGFYHLFDVNIYADQ